MLTYAGLYELLGARDMPYMNARTPRMHAMLLGAAMVIQGLCDAFVLADVLQMPPGEVLALCALQGGPTRTPPVTV